MASPKTNLVKGDLFVINLNDDNTEKLLLEVDKTDDERTIQAANPGNILLFLCL